MKNLLDIDSTDWFKAKLYFRTNRCHAYMEKGTNGVKHNFIKINNKLFAIAEGTTLGQGGFGIAKVTQTEDGENQAIKIEFRAKKDSDDRENKILEKLNMFYGMLERPLEREIEVQLGSNTFKTSHILYRVMELIPGRDLFSVLKDTTLTDTQKLITAIQATIALKKMHAFRIIHGDIKPSNMKVILEGNKISLRILDFGFSYLLPEGEFIARQDKKGTRGYVAPEIVRYGVYSCQSDIFALGKMFQNDLKLPSDIYDEMITLLPYNRPHYDKTLAKLITALKQQPNLDSIALTFISTVEQEHLLSVSHDVTEPSSSHAHVQEPSRLSQTDVLIPETRQSPPRTQREETLIEPTTETPVHRHVSPPRTTAHRRSPPPLPRRTQTLEQRPIMTIDRVAPTGHGEITELTTPVQTTTQQIQVEPMRTDPVTPTPSLDHTNENAPVVVEAPRRSYVPRFTHQTFRPEILGELTNHLNSMKRTNLRQ